jgi:hypothetical protein
MTTKLAALALLLATSAADARAYFFECGAAKVRVGVYREKGEAFFEVVISRQVNGFMCARRPAGVR